MTQFWLATAAFIVLGLSPLVLATTLNRRPHSGGSAPRTERERPAR